VVGLWRESLAKVNTKAAQSLADPTEYQNLFPGLEEAFKTEQFLSPQRQRVIPAQAYSSLPVSQAFIMFSLFKCLHFFVVFFRPIQIAILLKK
jgi:hypothetical protein